KALVNLLGEEPRAFGPTAVTVASTKSMAVSDTLSARMAARGLNDVAAPQATITVDIDAAGRRAMVTITLTGAIKPPLNLTVKDKDGTVLTSRTVKLQFNQNVYKELVPLALGDNTVTVTDANEVTGEGTAEGINVSGSDEEGELNWGRVRGYFSAGIVFSKEREEFSETDMFLDFTLDKNYIQSTNWNVNTFFSARLTALPVQAVDTTNNGGGGGGSNTDNLDTFLASKKAALMQAGVYIPIHPAAFRWTWDDANNALFLAPLAKGGIMTITEGNTSAEAQTLGDDDVYNFFSFGGRIGHFRMPDNSGASPELLSWLDLSMGRYENFELNIPTGEEDAQGNAITVRERRWRVVAEGRLKIPTLPLMIGFDGNFGDGPDDLRFGFGMRFDLGKLLKKLQTKAP
ncbi:MAG TPA: hypothetical protein VJ715_12775, partial [Pyrinomonadaceae bacterium]|nr:hypothetical protein [Pyrinomonadaceae bacterium]